MLSKRVLFITIINISLIFCANLLNAQRQLINPVGMIKYMPEASEEWELVSSISNPEMFAPYSTFVRQRYEMISPETYPDTSPDKYVVISFLNLNRLLETYYEDEIPKDDIDENIIDNNTPSANYLDNTTADNKSDNITYVSEYIDEKGCDITEKGGYLEGFETVERTSICDGILSNTLLIFLIDEEQYLLMVTIDSPLSMEILYDFVNIINLMELKKLAPR